MHQLMMYSCKLVPGVAKSMALYYHHLNRCISFISYNSDAESIESHQIASDAIDKINELRSDTSNFAWISEEELPFNINKQKIRQLDVFTELSRNILIVPVSNFIDQKNDLIFIYFNENTSNFMISNTVKALSTDHKIIIGTLMMNALNNFNEHLVKSRQQLMQHNLMVKYALNAVGENDKQQEGYRESYENAIIEYSNTIIHELGGQNNHYIYNFTDEAINKIKAFKGSLLLLRNVIIQAVDFAETLHLGIDTENISIEWKYLNFEMQQAREPQGRQLSYNRYSKTMQLLDKLEAAASLVMQRRQALTGINVGNACEKAISAPAISDALKKHRQKIITLMKEHSDKWPLIRNEFKPLLNILSLKPGIIDKKNEDHA
jgi:hypothetical protein